MFVAIAWSNAKELRLFKLFPEVIHCDATCDTNNSKNHLITFTGRTSTGKQFIFLRIWVVNQRRVMFKWIFSSVLINFVREEFFDYVKLCMVDGDPQQGSEMAIAIKNYMKNAFDGRCSRHIITQGWKRRIPGCHCVPSNLREEFKVIESRIKSWLYSFTKPGYVEDEMEYELSKKLLFSYLRSSTVARVFDSNDNLIRTVLDFVTNYVLVYTDNIAYFKRKAHRHYDVSSNNAHEGTNYGLKSHSASVKPCQKLDSAGKSLTLQGVLKVNDIESAALRDFTVKSLWSQLPTANHVTELADGILHSTMSRIDEYTCVSVGARKWQVFYTDHYATEFEADDLNCPIPRFRRIRTITWSSENVLHCSCCGFERTGLGCVHIASVIRKYFPNWKGYTHHDVSIRWWTMYINYCFREEYKELTLLFTKLIKNDIQGPSFPCNDYVAANNNIFQEEILYEDVNARVLNYSKEYMNELNAPAHGMTSSNQSFYDGLSQECSVCESDVYDGVFEQREDNFERSVAISFNTNVFDSRDYLKHSFNELIGCLDSLKSKEWNHHVQDVICDLVNQSRSKLRSHVSNKRKYDMFTVNIMSEQKNNSIKRTYASRNC